MLSIVIELMIQNFISLLSSTKGGFLIIVVSLDALLGIVA